MIRDLFVFMYNVSGVFNMKLAQVSLSKLCNCLKIFQNSHTFLDYFLDVKTLHFLS